MTERGAMLWLRYILFTHLMWLIMLNALLSCYSTNGEILRNGSVNQRRCQQTYDNLTSEHMARCEYAYERIHVEVMHNLIEL